MLKKDDNKVQCVHCKADDVGMTRYHVKIWKLICVKLQECNSLSQYTAEKTSSLLHLEQADTEIVIRV